MIWLFALFAFNAIMFAALYFRPLGVMSTVAGLNPERMNPMPKAIKSTSKPESPAADPIGALIENHRTERAAYHKAVREKYREIDIPDGATDAMLAAGRLLFTTRPATLLGVIGVLDYVGKPAERMQHDSNRIS